MHAASICGAGSWSRPSHLKSGSRTSRPDFRSGPAVLGTAARPRGDRGAAESEAELGRWQLAAGDLLIVDEASLAGTFALDRLAAQAREAGAKTVLVGVPQPSWGRRGRQGVRASRRRQGMPTTTGRLVGSPKPGNGGRVPNSGRVLRVGLTPTSATGGSPRGTRRRSWPLVTSPGRPTQRGANPRSWCLRQRHRERAKRPRPGDTVREPNGLGRADRAAEATWPRRDLPWLTGWLPVEATWWWLVATISTPVVLTASGEEPKLVPRAGGVHDEDLAKAIHGREEAIVRRTRDLAEQTVRAGAPGAKPFGTPPKNCTFANVWGDRLAVIADYWTPGA